jgi:hypothetical protein
MPGPVSYPFQITHSASNKPFGVAVCAQPHSCPDLDEIASLELACGRGGLYELRRCSAEGRNGEPSRSAKRAQRYNQEKTQHDGQEEGCGRLAMDGILNAAGRERSMRLGTVECGLARRSSSEFRQTDTVVACRDHWKEGERRDQYRQRPVAPEAPATRSGSKTISPDLHRQCAAAQQKPRQVQDDFSLVHNRYLNLSRLRRHRRLPDGSID